jgi:hypothetical protein
MEHIIRFTGAPAYQPSVQQLDPAVTTTPTVTPAIQPSELQSQGQPTT